MLLLLLFALPLKRFRMVFGWDVGSCLFVMSFKLLVVRMRLGDYIVHNFEVIYTMLLGNGKLIYIKIYTHVFVGILLIFYCSWERERGEKNKAQQTRTILLQLNVENCTSLIKEFAPFPCSLSFFLFFSSIISPFHQPIPIAISISNKSPNLTNKMINKRPI